MRRVTITLIAVFACGAVRGADGPDPIRVMSFNIRYGTAADGPNHWDRRKEFLAETIRAFDPDLLGTQETLAFQRNYLAERIEGYEGFAAGRDDGKERGEMAALFYRAARFEKIEGGHFWLSETPDTPGSKGWDAALPRVATWVRLKDRTDPAGLPVLFVNTHFDHRGRNARTEAARLIRRKVAELGRGSRVVVAGDFNAGEGTEPYTALFGPTDGKPSALVDTFRETHRTRGKSEGTFCGFRSDATGGDRIDWIAVSRDWEVRLAGIDHTERDGRTPSDHFPVTAVLRPSGPDLKPTVRVLSYNIHHDEGTDGKVDLKRLARIIRTADPDLVAIQEVDHKTRRTGGVDQTAELARLTGMHGAFGKAIDYDGGQYGQAVLARVPIGRTAVHQLPGEPDREKRIAFEVQVDHFGRELAFVTTHLHHQSDAFRRRQAAKLNDVVVGGRPTILAGDLNATPESEPLRLLRQHWTAATGETLGTFPAGRPSMQIDYVLFRPTDSFRVARSRVIYEPVASDHRPLLVVLELTGVGEPTSRPSGDRPTGEKPNE